MMIRWSLMLCFLLLLLGVTGISATFTSLTRPGDQVFVFTHTGPNIFFFLSLGLIVIAYTILLRMKKRWYLTIKARHLLGAAALLSLPLLFFPPLFSPDIYYSLAVGEQMNAGVNPYAVTIAESPTPVYSSLVVPEYQKHPLPYGPGWGWLLGGVIRLTGTHIGSAVVLVRVLLLAGFLASLLVLEKLLRSRGDWHKKALVLYCLNPLWYLFGVSEARSELLLAPLLVLALWLVHRRHYALAMLPVLVGGLVKWFPFFLIPLILILFLREQKLNPHRIRTLVLWAGGALLFLVVLLYFFDALRPIPHALLAQETFSSFNFFSTQVRLLLFGPPLYDTQGLSAPNTAFAFLGAFRGIFFAVVYLWTLRFFMKRRSDYHEAAFLTFFALLVTANWLMPWYFLWVFPFIVFDERLSQFIFGTSLLFIATIHQAFVVVVPVLLLVGVAMLFYRTTKGHILPLFVAQKITVKNS